MSSRALTFDALCQLRKVNHLQKNWTLTPFAPTRRRASGNMYIGPRARRMLQAVYALAFWCLLRSDEVLNIRMKDLKMVDPERNIMELTLTHRKTHQFECLCSHIIRYFHQTDLR